ncbi:MAG: SH3 domain-containing protein, partial [Chloroflexota bacterium]
MEHEERTFKVHTVQDFDFAALTSDVLSRLTDQIVAASEDADWWMTEDNLRYSLVRCFVLPGNYVCGWLTQQHRLHRHLYDDAKRETNESVVSFEDRFFAFHPNTNSVLIEWRRFRRMPPLTLARTVRNLSRILSAIAVRIGLEAEITLAPIHIVTTKEEFIEVFYSHNIVRVDI